MPETENTTGGARETAPNGATGRRGPVARHALAIAAVSLTLHLVFVFETADQPWFWNPIIDADEYDQAARTLFQTTDEPAAPYWHPPLYVYVLGVIYAASGGRILAAKLVQSLIGVGTCLLTWSIGRRVFGERVGFIGGLLVAVWGPMIFFDAELLAAGLTAFLNMLSLRLVLWAAEEPVARRWLICGVSIGLAALAMPNVVLCLAALLAWLAVRAARRRTRLDAAGPLLCLAGTVVAIAPVTIRNYVVSGEFIPISVNGGINFYVGNNPEAPRTIAYRPGRQWEQLRLEPQLHGITSPREADAYFYRKAFAYVRDDPAGFLGGLLRKAVLLVNARETPRNVDIYLFREDSTVLRAVLRRAGPIGVPFGIVVPFAVLGGIVAVRRDRRSWVLLGYAAGYGTSIAFVFVAARYRLAVVPVIALFGASGALWLIETARAARWRRLSTGLAVVALATAAVNWPMEAPTDDVNFRAELHHFLGMRAMRDGDDATAERELRGSVALDPDFAAARASLGNLLLQRGQIAGAEAQLRRAIELDPRFPHAYHSLGVAMMLQKRWAEAETLFRTALDILPLRHDARYQLGVALVRQGKPAAAAEQFRIGLELGAPRDEFEKALERVKSGAVRQAASAPGESNRR